VMLLAFAGLSISSRRLVPALAGILVGGAVVLGVVSAISGNGNATAFSRYKSITPTKVFKTTQEDRGGALAVVPRYIARFPLGHGLGSGGPASGVAGGRRSELSAESEFSFLVIEFGVLGLIIVVGFTLRLLYLSLGRIRRVSDPESRTLLAAIAAPIFGISALYVGGAPTATSPLAPYLWFVAGVMSFWLVSSSGGARVGLPAVGAKRPADVFAF
jgi:hypothetical protein